RMIRNVRRLNAASVQCAAHMFRQSVNLTTRPPDGFWSKVFGKYLVVTNTLGSGALLVIGDAVAQTVEQWQKKSQNRSLDYKRTGSMFFTGLLVGFVQHCFYTKLDTYFTDPSSKVVFRKMAIDQLIMSPSYILMFFYITSLLEGATIKESNAEISKKFWWTWMMDWCFWPGLQYLNFKYLRATYRVIFVNVSNCVYVVLLSYIKHGFGKSSI
ncbi:hypothetical protein KR018_011624, partial [Drosophila ironensis]